jgi:Tfp pilus assembly protein PilV
MPGRYKARWKVKMLQRYNVDPRGQCSRAGTRQSSIVNRQSAFTLLEVMIAAGIFFMAIFAILAVVSANIRNARLLQEPQVDAGMLLADLCQTNKLYEGSDSGDFGDLFPNYRWANQIKQVGTNGLFEVDYVISKRDGGPNSESTMSALLYRPDSPAGAAFAP